MHRDLIAKSNFIYILGARHCKYNIYFQGQGEYQLQRDQGYRGGQRGRPMYRHYYGPPPRGYYDGYYGYQAGPPRGGPRGRRGSRARGGFRGRRGVSISLLHKNIYQNLSVRPEIATIWGFLKLAD